QFETNTNFDKVFAISGVTGNGCQEVCYYMMNLLGSNIQSK
ncbi:MAG: hypothetical protein QG673_1401, partial [Pseudomonadota bacterium]|nr:hypothetical protein [Pseudomonadota bacterium]